MQECTTVLFHRKKAKNNHKNTIEKHGKYVIENLHLSFVVIAREQVGTQDTLTRDTQGMST